MRRIRLMVVITVLLILVGVILNLSGASFAVSKRIITGVHMGSVDLSGLSWEQAENKLAYSTKCLEKKVVHLYYGDKTWQIEAGMMGVSLDMEKTLEKALQVGYTGTLIKQWGERQNVKYNGQNITPVILIDQDKLQTRIMAEVGEIIKEPLDAGFSITNHDQVDIVPEQMGTKINFDSLSRDIVQTVTNYNGNTAMVELPLVAVTPQCTIKEIKAMGIDGLISQYSTYFNAGQVGRTYNIKVAAAALDGLLIAPGEEFSFNKVVGPRSSEAGYKNANVIINNALVQGLGGGVCQVSSSIYNAVLLANLVVTERKNHSLPVGYVPIGRDATVVYGAIDFKFCNNKNNYIYIKSLVEGNSLTFKIFGNKENFPPVELASWVTEEIEAKVVYEKDPNLAAGEKVVKQNGSKGYKVDTVRYIWQKGKQVTEKLPASYYQPVNRIVAMGTGEIKPTVVIPPDEDLTGSDIGEQVHTEVHVSEDLNNEAVEQDMPVDMDAVDIIDEESEQEDAEQPYVPDNTTVDIIEEEGEQDMEQPYVPDNTTVDIIDEEGEQDMEQPYVPDNTTVDIIDEEGEQDTEQPHVLDNTNTADISNEEGGEQDAEPEIRDDELVSPEPVP